jgi:hypothetical protein
MDDEHKLDPRTEARDEVRNLLRLSEGLPPGIEVENSLLDETSLVFSYEGRTWSIDWGVFGLMPSVPLLALALGRLEAL